MLLNIKCKQRELQLEIGLLAIGLSANLLWSGVQEGEIAQIRSQLFNQQKFNNILKTSDMKLEIYFQHSQTLDILWKSKG